MIVNGKYEEPFALLYKWGYYLNSKICHVDWATMAVEQYIYRKVYNIILLDVMVGKDNFSMHCVHRIVRKVSSNIFQQLPRM